MLVKSPPNESVSRGDMSIGQLGYLRGRYLVIESSYIMVVPNTRTHVYTEHKKDRGCSLDGPMLSHSIGQVQDVRSDEA